MTTAEPTAPIAPRARRRRVWPFVALAVVLVVLVVAFVAADAAARSYAESRIRTQLTSALGLSSSTDVKVDLGGGSILLQALTGKVDTVDITVPELEVHGLVGVGEIRATQVPIDTSKPLKTLDVTYTVTEKKLAAIATNLSGVTVDSVILKKPDIVATSTPTILGVNVPVTLSVTPSASQGLIVFTPSRVELAGQTFSADALRDSPLFGSLAKKLLTQKNFCVASALPKALTVSSVAVVGKTLEVSLTGDGAVLGSSDFTTKGIC